MLKRLRAEGVRSLRGNTDRMIALSDITVLDPQDARAVRWARKKIGREWSIWLGELPLTIAFGNDENGLLICHANPKNDDEHVWPDADDAQLERLFGGVPQRTIAFGHLHLPYVRLWRGRMLVNVASAGLPKDGDARAHYTIFTRRGDGWEVQPRRVDFNVKKVARQLRRSGIPDLDKHVATLRRHRYPKLGTPGSLIP